MMVALEKALFSRPLPFLVCAVCILTLSAAYTACFSQLRAAVGTPGLSVVSRIRRLLSLQHSEAQAQEAQVHRNHDAACCISWVTALHVGMYLSAAFTGICCIVVLRHPASLAQDLLIAFPLGLGAINLVTCAVGVSAYLRESARRKAAQDASIDTVRAELLALLEAMSSHPETCLPGFIKSNRSP